MLDKIINGAVTYGPYVIAAAAAAAATLPASKPGTLWYVIRQAIDVLALNIGNAKNAGKK